MKSFFKSVLILSFLVSLNGFAQQKEEPFRWKAQPWKVNCWTNKDPDANLGLVALEFHPKMQTYSFEGFDMIRDFSEIVPSISRVYAYKEVCEEEFREFCNEDSPYSESVKIFAPKIEPTRNADGSVNQEWLDEIQTKFQKFAQKYPISRVDCYGFIPRPGPGSRVGN